MVDNILSVISHHHRHLMTQGYKKNRPYQINSSKTSNDASKIAYGMHPVETKRLVVAKVRSRPCWWIKIMKTSEPWTFSVDCVDRSVLILNYHYFLDQHYVGKIS